MRAGSLGHPRCSPTCTRQARLPFSRRRSASGCGCPELPNGRKIRDEKRSRATATSVRVAWVYLQRFSIHYKCSTALIAPLVKTRYKKALRVSMSLRDELSLSELIKHLEAGCPAVGPAKMRDILERLVISAEEMRVYSLFSDKRYARNLVHKTARFEIMIMCWHAGQRSSIHDHAGSLGGLKILRGALTESLFEKAPNGMIKSQNSIDYAAGEARVEETSLIHQISNLQSEN